MAMREDLLSTEKVARSLSFETPALKEMRANLLKELVELELLLEKRLQQANLKRMNAKSIHEEDMHEEKHGDKHEDMHDLPTIHGNTHASDPEPAAANFQPDTKIGPISLILSPVGLEYFPTFMFMHACMY